MVKKSKGFRVRTRKKLRQRAGVRPAITKFLQELDIGQNVVIEQEPSSQKGMPYGKFKGKVGTIIEKRGNSYIVKTRIGNSTKLIVSRPEHLKII
ncbi:MAG: 50S ribosomal protein L21e [Candidatus Aenigmarchaeota archaeon]|nr:50S ribosomal protein L21e [Candidatus Aenigmarchaeota archaeon]